MEIELSGELYNLTHTYFAKRSVYRTHLYLHRKSNNSDKLVSKIPITKKQYEELQKRLSEEDLEVKVKIKVSSK